MYFSRTPLLWIFITMAAGIAALRFLGANIFWMFMPVLPAIYFIVKGKTWFAILCCSFLLGFTVAWLDMPLIPHGFYNNPRNIFYGTVTEIKTTNSGLRNIVCIDSVEIESVRYPVHNASVIVNTFDFSADVRPYDYVRFRTSVNPVGYTPLLPDDTDFRNYYFYNGIVGETNASQNDYVKTSEAYGIIARFARYRMRLSDIMANCGISYDTAMMLTALMLGNSGSIDNDTASFFTDAGIAHVLALSGTHVAVISSFVFVLLFPLRRFGLRVTVYVTAMAAMWLYALLTGMSASVTRAVIMLSALYLSYIAGRQSNCLNVLCFAAVIILAFSPLALFSPAFQLSFSAVAGIILFTGTSTGTDNRLYRRIGDFFTVSAAALLATALLSAYYFHKFPVYGLIANIPIAIILPLFLICGFLLLITASLGIPFTFGAAIADFLGTLLTGTARYFSSLPFSSIQGIYFSAWIFIPFILSLLAFYFYRTRNERYFLSTSVLCMAITVLLVIPRPISSKSTRFFLLGDRYGTEVLIENHGRALLAGTRKNETSSETAGRLMRTHPAFFKRRMMETISPIGDGYDSPEISRHGRMLWIGDRTLALIGSSSDALRPLPGNKADYGILYYNPSEEELFALSSCLHIDTIIITREIHKLHENRIRSILEKHGRPYLSMRDGSIWR